MVNLSKFMATHGNEVVILRSFIMYMFWHCAAIVLDDWGTLPFNKLLSMGSYDFVTADKFGKMVGRFLALCLRIWLFSGLGLAPWQKVDLATLWRSVSRLIGALLATAVRLMLLWVWQWLQSCGPIFLRCCDNFKHEFIWLYGTL